MPGGLGFSPESYSIGLDPPRRSKLLVQEKTSTAGLSIKEAMVGLLAWRGFLNHMREIYCAADLESASLDVAGMGQTRRAENLF